MRRVERELDRELPRALALGGDLVVNEARRSRLFTDRTGRLRRSIMRGPITGSYGAGTLAIDVHAGGLGGVEYAGYVHDGTRPHVIAPAKRKALRFVQAGSFRFAGRVNHPGTAPRPFMDEALARTSDQFARVLTSATRLAFVRAGFEVA